MKVLIVFILFLLTNLAVQASNNEDIICAGNIPESAIKAQTGGFYKPSSNAPNEYMKVLVVFVQFAGTDVDVNNPTWPKDQLPTWAGDLISSSPSGSYPEFTISDYWKDMSHGNFDFVGTVYPNLVIINTEDYYKNNPNGYHFGQCNKDALTQINPYVVFSDYDKWSFNSSTGEFEFAPDGYVDMIFMIYRTPNNDGGWFDAGYDDFHAIALLSDFDFTLNFDGVTIFGDNWISNLGSGITVKKGLKSLYDTLPMLAHEYGHYLFGSGHSNTGGNMSNMKLYSLNAVERERLGYIAYTNCTQNNFTLTLEDFIEHGDILRIPIPISNQSSTTFFLVENHQKSSKYDQIIRGGAIGGGYDYTDIGSGIYVWLVKNGDSYIPSVYYEAVTADGRWDWTYDGDYYAGPGWYIGLPWEGYLPKTKRTAVNRNTGKTDKKEAHIYWNGHWAAKWVDNQPSGSYQITRDVMGDEYDAFNFGYNELLTPWSNPSTYVNGTTNISIQLYNHNENNITIKVFTTEASAEALPPAKPQDLKVAVQNNHPYLTWYANSEPDTNHYEIWKKSFGGFWYLRATTTNSYWEDTDAQVYVYKSRNHIDIDYKIKAVDNDAQKSIYSNQVSITVNSDIGPAFKIGTTENENTITQFKLHPNYPNPFNPVTQISFDLPGETRISLIVYDVQGKIVKELVQNETFDPGTYQVLFDATSLASGTYIYKLIAGKNVLTKRMLLIK